jgi:cysteine-rich repeat protein
MTFCLPCDVACTSCTGSSNADCQSCNPTFILTGTTCACASQQYVDPTTSQCANCDYTCQTCNGTTANDCLTCDLSRSIAGTSCPCNTGLFDIGLAVCYSSNCNVGYAPNATGVCQEICGDGFLYILPCDDGNTLSGDGCSSTCEVETNYTCQGGSPTSASICSYNQPITLKLVSTIKNLTSNIVYFTIQIQPTMPALKGLNFSSVLSCNLTGASLDYVYDSTTGLLMVAAAYTSSIQSQDVKLQFIPSVSSSSPYFFATPPSSFSFVVNPQNNLAATSLDNNVYSGVHTFDILWQVLLYLALAGMLLAMFTSRFIGVEMVGVVQIAFIGLCMIDYLQPLISPMTKMFPINFVNSALQGTATNNSALPDRVAVLQYGVDLLYSFNYSLLLLLLPGMVSLALYIASKIRKDI